MTGRHLIEVVKLLPGTEPGSTHMVWVTAPDARRSRYSHRSRATAVRFAREQKRLIESDGGKCLLHIDPEGDA